MYSTLLYIRTKSLSSYCSSNKATFVLFNPILTSPLISFWYQIKTYCPTLGRV